MLSTMLDYRFTLFLILILARDGYATIRPSASLSIMIDEGFIVFLDVPKSFGAVKNCWFRFKDENKVQIDLNLTTPIETERGESVLPFSTSICGIRVLKLSTASMGRWVLEAENEYGDFEQDFVEIHPLPPQKTRFDTHVQREIGDGSISCSKHDSYTKHCKIIEDNGDITDSCELSATIRPNRTFECMMYNWGRMAESHEFIYVDIKNSTVHTTGTVEETDSSFILRCQFKGALYSCQAEKPDRKSEIYIMDGLYNGRYSVYDTNIKQSRCSLEIPKPLDDKDRGLWRIINYESNTESGCLFYIGGNKSEIIKQELENIRKTKTIKLYQPENGSTQTIKEISCTVPYMISDCYLKDPNNTVYFPDTFIIEKKGLIGKCEFTNLLVIAGTWMCGARGRDHDKEVVQEIEVMVKPRKGEVLTEFLKIKEKGNLELMCTSSYEEPLTHCAYVDPQGNVHLVGTTNSLKTAGHVQYFGRGLLYGECGAKITGVISDDFGEWKCQFVQYSRRTISTFSIEVKQSATAHATSVGLGVGITIMIVLVLGVAAGTIFYRRRNMSARHNFRSEDPLEISTNVETTTT